MNARDAAIAGAAGALTTNLLHETVRRIVPSAPRVDLLGMQALARDVDAAGAPVPHGRNLYALTLAGDLLSNSTYFALVGMATDRRAVTRLGLALGLGAGIGAVVLPRPLGLTPAATSRTLVTRLLTIGFYTAGGVVASAVANARSSPS